MLLKFQWSETYKNRPSKVKVASFCAAHQGWEKEAWNLVGFFGFWRQYAHLGILLTRQPIRLSVLRGVQSNKGFYSRSRLSFKMPCHLDLMTQHIQWYRQCPWQTEMLYRLWSSPTEWQCTFLGFRNMARTSSTNNYFTFAKQLLVGY